MAAVNLIVCEQHGTWAAALRRTLDHAVALRQTRSLHECGRELTERPAGVLAVELTARRAARVAAFVAWVNQRCPHTRPIVLAERRLAPLEWWLREAGAAHFVTSSRQLEPVAEIVSRQARRMPPQALSWSEKFWAELPWRD